MIDFGIFHELLSTQMLNETFSVIFNHCAGFSLIVPSIKMCDKGQKHEKLQGRCCIKAQMHFGELYSRMGIQKK